MGRRRKTKRKRGSFSGERYADIVKKTAPMKMQHLTFDHLDAQRQEIEFSNIDPNGSQDKVIINQSSYDTFTDVVEMDLLNISQISKLLCQHTICKQCLKTRTLTINVIKRVGLASYFELVCTNEACGFREKFSNSKSRVYEYKGKNIELEPINLALVHGARISGIGEAATKRLCTFLNLNQPPDAWVKHQNILHHAFLIRAYFSMKRALEEAKNEALLRTGYPYLTVSFDGSWMNRGFKSILGITTAINLMTNKIVGIDVRHKFCQMCKGKGQCKYGQDCGINHDGSSGSMESVGVAKIIKEIYELYNLQITKYLGDGDSRGFEKAKAQVDWIMEKLECINHIGKRMGCRLRKKKLEKKNIMLIRGSRRKGIGRAGWLTNPAINKIQRYYSFIIRNYKGDVELMSRRIMGMYKHISSTDEVPQHEDCDPLICKYHLANDKKEKYSHKNKAHFHIPPFVMLHVKDTFEDLSKVELLEKVAHGKTQNANECMNSTVWNLLSKNGFANRKLAELTVYMAVCLYNEGQIAILDVLESLGISIEVKMATRCKAVDMLRVKKRNRAQSTKNKKRRREDDEQDDDYQPGLC